MRNGAVQPATMGAGAAPARRLTRSEAACAREEAKARDRVVAADADNAVLGRALTKLGDAVLSQPTGAAQDAAQQRAASVLADLPYLLAHPDLLSQLVGEFVPPETGGELGEGPEPTDGAQPAVPTPPPAAPATGTVRAVQDLCGAAPATAAARLTALGAMTGALQHRAALCKDCRQPHPRVWCGCRSVSGHLLCYTCDSARHGISPCSVGRFALINTPRGLPVLRELRVNEFVDAVPSSVPPASDFISAVAVQASSGGDTTASSLASSTTADTTPSASLDSPSSPAATAAATAASESCIKRRLLPVPVQVSRSADSCRQCGSWACEPIAWDYTTGSPVHVFHPTWSWDGGLVRAVACGGCGTARDWSVPLEDGLPFAYRFVNSRSIVSRDVSDQVVLEASTGALRGDGERAAAVGRGRDLAPPIGQPQLQFRGARQAFSLFRLYAAHPLARLFGYGAACIACGSLPRRLACDGNAKAFQRRTAPAADMTIDLPGSPFCADAASLAAFEAVKFNADVTRSSSQCVDTATGASSSWTAAANRGATASEKEHRISGIFVEACDHGIAQAAVAMPVREQPAFHVVSLLRAALTGTPYVLSDIYCLVYAHVRHQSALSGTWLTGAVRALLGDSTVTATVTTAGVGEVPSVTLTVRPTPAAVLSAAGAAVAPAGAAPAAAPCPPTAFPRVYAAIRTSGFYRAVIEGGIPAMHRWGHLCRGVHDAASVKGSGLDAEVIEQLFSRVTSPSSSSARNAALGFYRAHHGVTLALANAQRNANAPLLLLQQAVRAIAALLSQNDVVTARRAAYEASTPTAQQRPNSALLAAADSARREGPRAAAQASATRKAQDAELRRLRIVHAIAVLRSISAEAKAAPDAPVSLRTQLLLTSEARSVLDAVRAGPIVDLPSADAALAKLEAKAVALKRAAGNVVLEAEPLIQRFLDAARASAACVQRRLIELTRERGGAWYHERQLQAYHQQRHTNYATVLPLAD